MYNIQNKNKSYGEILRIDIKMFNLMERNNKT